MYKNEAMSVFSFDCGYFDLAILFISIILIILWKRSRRPVNYPPGPPTIPIIGNIHNIATVDFLQRIRDLRKKYGDVFSLSVGSYWVIVVNGSTNLRELLVRRCEVTTDRPPLYMFNLAKNKGIVSSSGIEWKHQRTFALSKLRDFGFGKRSFESSIMEEIKIFLDLLESYNGEPFDISKIIQTSMSNNIMSITIGRRFDYDDPHFKYFVQLLHETVTNAAFSGPLNFIPFLAKLPGDPFRGKRMKQIADQIFDFFRGYISEHENTLDSNNIRDFIDVYLMEMKENQNSENSFYTAEQLLSTMGDLFGAGTETTTSAFRWAVVYLINNIDVQQKMRKEIDDVVGFGRFPSMSDKPNLPYCEAVVQETLRLGNVVPFSLPHHVSEDIDFNGYTIPKNAVLLPSLDSVVFDEHLFPDCCTFKPERFIDGNGKFCGQEKILSFSLGRRVCLGESLARMELFLYLTSLIQRFECLSPEGESPPSIIGELGLTHSPKIFNFRAIYRK